MTGYFFSARDRGLHEEAHEADLDAVLLLELLLEALAHLHHRRHVHFVERGQDGVGRLATAAGARRCARAGGSSARAARGGRRGSAAAGAATGGSGCRRRRRCGAAGAARRPARRPALAPSRRARSSTSPLVTRPSLPVPGTEPAVRSLLGHQLGGGRHRDVALGLGARRDRGWTPALAPAPARRRHALICSAPAAPALPSVSILAITSSATTAVAVVLDDLGEHAGGGAGTSSTTLSVSISIRISSSATASPGFFFHCSRVASATDSDSCGTLTSIDVPCLVSVRLRAVVRRQRASSILLGQNEALELAEGLLEQRLLLLLVQVRVAHRRRRRRRPAGIAELLAFDHVLVDVVLDEEPGALVLRLVLAPDDLGQRSGTSSARPRTPCAGTDRAARRGRSRRRSCLAFVALLDQVVVDLARAGDHALDLARRRSRRSARR